MSVIKCARSTLLVVWTVLVCSTANAGFFGSTVSANYAWPSVGTVLYPSGNAVAGAGIEFPGVGSAIAVVDFADNGFRITYPNGWLFNTVNPKSFDGWVIAKVAGTAPAIAGVSLNGTNIPGFAASHLSFDATRVFVNQLGFTEFAPGSFIDVGVVFPPPPGNCALTATPSSLAVGGQVVLTVSCAGGGAPSSYTWTGGFANGLTTSANTISGVIAATTTFTVVATSAGGSSSVVSVTVPVGGVSSGAPSISFFYAVAKDGIDRGLDNDGTLTTSILSWNNWFRQQTGGRGFRLDATNGLPDIVFVRLNQTEAAYEANGVFIRDALEAELRSRGYLQSGKLYGLYYDGPAMDHCGGAPYPPLLPGQVGAVYLRGHFADPAVPPCSTNPFVTSPTAPPGYIELSMLHELVHALGHVPACSPHHTRQGHVSDDQHDLMYADAVKPWLYQSPVLDANRDDYFGHGRSDCPDLATNPFLESPVAPPPGSAVARVVSNPYGALTVQGATLVGNDLSNLQGNTVIQLGGTPGSAGSLAEFDFEGLAIGPGETLTIRSGAPGQTVLIQVVDATPTAIRGSFQTQGGNGAPAPQLLLNNRNGITVAQGGSVQSPSGLSVDTLGASSTVGQDLVNNGIIDGGNRLDLLAARINGGGEFKGNAVTVSTFGNANNPVNGSHFLANGLNFRPGSGTQVTLTINDYGTSPQFLNLLVHGDVRVSMPSAWQAGSALPSNNAPLPVGGNRPPGGPEPSYGGGSLIVQATGALTLDGGGSNDFVFAGGIVLKSGGTLDANDVYINQGWTTTGKAFQGVFLESPNIVSSTGIRVYTNNLNWVNFSTLPQAPVRAFTLVANPNGSASFATADSTAPHVNIYSVLIDAAADGRCWTCLVNSQPVNVFGP